MTRRPIRTLQLTAMTAVGALAALAQLASTGPVSATSFAAVSDRTLVAEAELVAMVRVEGTLPPGVEGRPATDYLVTAERILKGQLGSSALVVRVPGGVRADGIGQRIWGAPTFRDGERALLFLVPGAEGTWQVLYLMQGAFHHLEVDGETVAVRDLAEARMLPGPDRRASRDFRRVRDFHRFARWIEERAAGIRRGPDYFLRIRPERVQALFDKFALFEEGGINLRWFDFDSGGSVAYRASETAQLGLPSGGYTEFQQALEDWNNESSTPINLRYVGTTTATGGLKNYDGTNAILFNDPNAEIEDTFSCTGGGTLAYGGPWYDSTTRSQFGGRTFIEILGADIVTNDGIACFFERSGNAGKAAEELFAHELGHNLGLGHASEDRAEENSTLRQALMYAYIHNDGRGGQLNSDDIAGLRALYTVGGGIPTCEAGGGALCLLNQRFQISVTYQNQYNGHAGSGGAVPYTDLSGFLYFEDPSNIELIVKVLDFGTEIKVFYSQLTDLKFQMKVTDTATGRTKTYTNTSGECGAIDHDFSKVALAGALVLPKEGHELLARAGSCASDSTTLCLLEGRFRLTADWRNQYSGVSGVGQAVELTRLTGAFAFTSTANLEILVKTLDFGDKYIVLYGSLSNFEYNLRITDTVSGRSKTYFNPADKYCGGIDTTSFPK